MKGNLSRGFEKSDTSKGIIFHIDETIVSFREIKIVGWAISSNDKKLNYQHSRKSKLETSIREDVNKYHEFIKNNNESGFELVSKSWLFEHIIISDGEDEIHININCLKKKIGYFIRTLKSVYSKIRTVGFVRAMKLVKLKINKKPIESLNNNYMSWRDKYILSSEEILKQSRTVFKYAPKISIVVPTYNTPAYFLEAMLDSVVKQTYSNWELCIADGKSANEETIEILKRYEQNYHNIRVAYLSENKMISGNTNEGLKLVRGEYVGFLDHDDLLEPNALFEMVSLLNKHEYDMIYSDEDKTNLDGSIYFEPHFKPDFSQYTLRSYNYITHFTIIRKTILDKVGEFDYHCDGAQDYDLFLRVSDATKNIGHISKVLYHWRVHEQSTAASAGAKSYVTNSGILALQKHLDRNNIIAKVKNGLFPTAYKVDYKIKDSPLVSIIIPNKDHIEDLKLCLKSIREKSNYKNYEIIVVENNSELDATFSYYEHLKNEKNIKVINWSKEFNFSAINNFGVKTAKGDYILLLNNDVEIINKNWLSEMLMLATQEGVGAVGAKLYYEDDSIQHAGVILGIGGVAGHAHKYYSRDSFGYVGRLKIVQNMSAVTAACLLIKKRIFDEVGGLDEEYKVAFNDVDFCLRVGKKGYQNVFTPYSELYHYESKSRGLEDTEEKVIRFNSEISRFKSKWGLWIEDPYYNCNLSITHEDFSLRES